MREWGRGEGDTEIPPHPATAKLAPLAKPSHPSPGGRGKLNAPSPPEPHPGLLYQMLVEPARRPIDGRWI